MSCGGAVTEIHNTILKNIGTYHTSLAVDEEQRMSFKESDDRRFG